MILIKILVVNFMWIIIIGLIICILLLFLYLNNNILLTKSYTVYKNVNNEIKIIHLSDLHGKSFGKDNIKLIKKIDEQSPDVIFFTGDLITEGEKNIKKSTDFLGNLAEKYPVFFIFGNHEYRKNQQDEVENLLKKTKVVVLKNDIYKTNIKGNDINILGLSYMQGDFKDYISMAKGKFSYPDMGDKIKELEKCHGVKIILSHYPENFCLAKEKNFNQYDYDFYFAGHAHGGQFRLPIIGPIYGAGQGFFPKYTKGLYGNHPKMIVSPGLGCSTIPFRIFNPPEIILLNIKNND